MVSTVSWADEVVHKTCCFDLGSFLDRFTRSQKLRIFRTLYHDRGHFCGHHNSLNFDLQMVSTVSWDDEVHKIYCFDIDLFLTFLKGHKKLEFSHIV